MSRNAPPITVSETYRDRPLPSKSKNFSPYRERLNALAVWESLDISGRNTQNLLNVVSDANRTLWPKRFTGRRLGAKCVGVWRLEDTLAGQPRLLISRAVANAKTAACPECGTSSPVSEWIDGRCLDCAPLGAVKGAR